MSTYNGVTFYTLTPSGDRPEWSQEANIRLEHIPYSNHDDLQDAGRGNHRVVVPAMVESQAAVNSLKASVGSTLRTLGGWFGSDYPSTALVAVRSIKRLPGVSSQTWTLELEFVREGS